MDPTEILHFWFEDIEEKAWWIKDPAFDQNLRERFGDLHDSACKGELFEWRGSAGGRLAEVIVLGQFSRNIYRNQARAFSQDGMALVLAQEAVRLGLDHQLSDRQRGVLYLPYMHSESRAIHEVAVSLYKSIETNNLDFEYKHKAIIDRFGRYPHRNDILGRESSAEELAFLQEKGSSF